MIGKTNAVVGGGAPTEKVNVTLTSNQSSTSDLSGAKVTLSYGSYSEDFVWSGKTITLSVMQYITYTLSFSNVSGYKTPAPVEFTAVADNVRQVNAQYQTEVVTVTVSADSGVSVSGQKVTIDGVTTTLTRTGKVTQKVPYGTSYSVSVNDKSGYYSPATQTFTASQPARSVSMVYEEIRLGVYIQDTTGKLWTASEWNGSATPNGVAVLTDACRFVIALEEQTYVRIGLHEDADSLTLPEYTYTDALTDYDGYSNTLSLVSTFGSDKTLAAGYCKSFTFPNGSVGYLGSAGEWDVVFDNMNQIRNCMSTVFGQSFGYYYWTSTRGESIYDYGFFYSKFWVAYMNIPEFNAEDITSDSYAARPFTTL